MLTTRFRRVVACLALTVALTGCADERPGVVRGGGAPDPQPSASAPASATGQPLTAADLPGWTDEALPAGASESLVAPCGTPTGVRARQAGTRAAAVASPTGITVLTQVADYPQGTVPAWVVSEVIAPALVACPAYTDGQDEVTVRSLPAPGGVSAAGAEIVRTHPDGSRTVTVYWAVVTGEWTVEVAVAGLMGPIGTSPLEGFAREVLTAAQAKALGQAVPVVSAPQLPPLGGDADPDAASGDGGWAASEGAQSTDPGAPAAGEVGSDDGFVENTDLPPGYRVPADPVIPDHGIVGETGPGIERAHIAP